MLFSMPFLYSISLKWLQFRNIPFGQPLTAIRCSPHAPVLFYSWSFVCSFVRCAVRCCNCLLKVYYSLLYKKMSIHTSYDICLVTGIPVSQQHLIWNGMELEDEYCLHDYRWVFKLFSSFTKQDPGCYITISKLNYRMFHWIWQGAFWKMKL